MNNWPRWFPKSTVGGAAFVFVFAFLLILAMNTVFWPGRDWWRSVFGAAGGTLGYLIAKRYLAEKESK